MADNTFENKENATETETDKIKETGSVITGDGSIHCLTIIGQVEGHYIFGDNQKATKYEHIIPMLVAIEESTEIQGLLVVLNTMGGDVEAGLAIAEMIASMKKPTVSLVLGGSHSIGVPLAVAAKKSFIVPSATMTIHPVRINGLVGAFRVLFLIGYAIGQLICMLYIRSLCFTGCRFLLTAGKRSGHKTAG